MHAFDYTKMFYACFVTRLLNDPHLIKLRAELCTSCVARSDKVQNKSQIYIMHQVQHWLQ